MTETFDLRIDSIASGGDGVGRRDGMVVFVPRAAPGDLLRVRGRRRDRMIRAEILDITHPSSHRIDPGCHHYVEDRCGGCQLQHLSYDAQLDAKAGIIHDTLTRIGKVAAARPSVEASDRQWRYRLKLTLAIRKRDDRYFAGLRRYDDADDVFELHDCPITDERVVHIWKSVMRQQELFPDGPELRGAVRALDTGFSFSLEGGTAWPYSRRFFESVPELVQLWWRPEGGARRLAESRQDSRALPGASFVQVNRDVAIRLREWVLSLATKASPAVVVDAYAGTGDYAVALARAGARVTAIEIDREASRVCASRLPEGSSAVAAPVEQALAKALPADVVIVNPPRTGVDAKVADVLRMQSAPPRTLIYVSCDPATLARDVRRLERYSIRSLRGFDMFPQTAHVETVCELVPAA